MNKIGIIADTAQDLDLELGEKYGIEILSYHVQMGEKTFKDLVDIDSRTFYQTMDQYNTLQTAIPSVQDLIEILDNMKGQGIEDVIIIVCTEKLTGMEGLAGTVQSYYEGLNIHIYQTNQIGSSAGLFSIYAAELRDKGLSVEEITSELNRIKNGEKATIHALFRTLKYLIKGGRFNKYKGMIGMFLHINPLLKVEDGLIEVIDKIRGKTKSLNALADKIREEIGESKKYRIIIFSGDNDEEVEELKEILKDLIDGAELYLQTEFTSVLGVHAGPKSIGIATMKLD